MFNKDLLIITIKGVTGFVLIIGGIILTFKPGLLGADPEQLTGYEMIEKRVSWGALTGLGIFLILFQQWGSWGPTIWGLLAALTKGIILSRILGLVLDGIFTKQLLWLLIEGVLGAIFSWLYLRSTN